MNRHAKATVAISAMLLLIVFGATVASADNPPSLSVQAASEVGYLQAKLNGKVNPEGGPSATSWHFELSATPEGEESWVQFDGGGSIEGTEAEKTESVAVQSTATGLKPGHTYLIRLIAENEGGANRVESPAPYVSLTTKATATPSVQPIDVSAITSTSAHFKAQVNPNAPEDNASLGQEAKEAFETDWSFSCTPQCSGLQGGALEADDSFSEVASNAYLTPNTEYTLTLTAQNRGAKKELSTTFSTASTKATVKAFAAGPVSFDQATINGEVNPLNAPTTYWFEWGTEDCETSSCQSSAHQSAGFNEQQRVVVDATAGQFNLSFEGQTTADIAFSASPADVEAALEALSTIGSNNVSVSGEALHYLVTFTGALASTDVEAMTAAEGATPLTVNEGTESGSVAVATVITGGYSNGSKHVSQLLSGLSPETTYHFRLIAENAAGTTEGTDGEFTTAAPEAPCTNQGLPGTNFLPDCRAYEMVSPTEKNGADVIPNSPKTFAAEVGEGVSYPTLGAFGDVKGTAPDVQYLSRRTGTPGTNGWATHSINPLGHAPTGSALILKNAGSGFQALTPDLSDGIYKVWLTLDDSPNVAEVANLYRLRDLEANQPQLDLLTPSAAPINGITAPGLQNRYVGASKDLSHVFFQSPYDLTGDGSFSEEPGNLYEHADGTGVRKVGRIPSGSATECDDQGGPACEDVANVRAGLPASLLYGTSEYSQEIISEDGSRVLFSTETGAIYMREDGERTYQLNASEKNTPDSPTDAQAWAMSSDGSRVFFTTSEELVDAAEGDVGGGLYMYEVGKPARHRLTLLSVDSEPADGPPRIASVVGASDDGHYVYFVSGGQLVAGEPPNVFQGLYLWHDGQISYVGAFNAFNVANVNTPGTSWQFVSATKTSRVSSDGRHLLFMSTYDPGFAGRGGYPGYDHGGGFGHRELYLYSADTGSLSCVSCNPQSGVASADALTDVDPGVSASALAQHSSHALSADGRHVFFSTTESLVSEDTNGVSDAYEYDAASGEVHLISSGTSPTDSYFMDASPDGKDVFFDTRERLVGWDNDNSYDLYDARVNGGFPEPVPVPAPCEGESCLPSSKPAPGISAAASSATGPGNPKPACPKGSKRVRKGGKSRCVAKKAHKAQAKQTKANNNRRASR